MFGQQKRREITYSHYAHHLGQSEDSFNYALSAYATFGVTCFSASCQYINLSHRQAVNIRVKSNDCL